MKKIISFIFILVIIISGCDSQSSEGDDVLTIWGFFEANPKTALDDYASETGNEVEYVNIGYEDFETKLNTVIGTDDAPDIVLLDRTWLGKYIASDNFLSFEEVMEDSEQLDYYKSNAQNVALEPGMIDDNLKAYSIAGSPSSVYFYRSDIAEKCLGITSPDEMEELTPTFESYADLQVRMNESEDESCHDVAITGYPSYQFGLTSLAGMYNLEEDGSYVIPKEFDDILEEIKDINDKGLVYSPQYDSTQVADGNQKDKILGEISPNYLNATIKQYEQPEQWAVAQTPLNYSVGGSFIAVTNNADTDMVSEYMDMTFLNQEWNADHLSVSGAAADPTIVDKYLSENDASDEYYSGQVVIQEFSDAADKVDVVAGVTPYDVGITQSIDYIISSFAVDKSITNVDDAKEQLKLNINELYPDLEIVIE